jgi:hypothetical protein
MKNQNQTGILLKGKIIGFTARQVCSQRPKGKVLASVTDTIYLETEAGDLFWITGENEPLHWRSIRVHGQVPRTKERTEFSVDLNNIIFDDGLKIDLSGASEWQTKIPESANIFSITSIYPKTRDIYAELADVPRNGFGNFIPDIVINMSDPSKGKNQVFQDPILRRAWILIQDIVLESSRHNFKLALEKAENLLGLGTGLTPSGDDFIGGLFFTFHFLGNVFHGQMSFNQSALEGFLTRSRKKTNLISFTLMQDMSLGHGLAPLHEILNSILTNQPNDRIVTSALELAKVGNSTGWDILTGVLAGLISTRSFSKECN